MSKDDVVIECSWNLDVDQVREKIIWKTGEQGELTEEADAENCFTISSNPSSAEAEPCTLKFVLSNNRKFSSLHVLSEVPMMEVFGQFGEYLMTAKGELLDEDTSLYETKIDLKRLQTELLLKFCKVKDKDILWVFGISAVTKETPAPLKPMGSQLLDPGSSALRSSLNPLLSSLMPGLNNSSGFAKSFENVEKLVDQKIKDMEQRIMSRIEQRFDLLQEKMDQNNDKLMTLLSEIKQAK